jgi:UDP-N-acetylmuramyl pentapeptide phosphotransferase/UDP-N-acetylglucosamine-1-phosphate transferase
MSLPSLPSLPPSVYMAGIVALLVAFFLVSTKRWHGHFSMDSHTGIQRTHSDPTPRIGGVSIFAGVMAAWLVAAPERASIFSALLLAGLPAFVFGLAEDVTKRVGVLARLLATMASGVLGWWLTGYSLSSVGIPYVDVLFTFLPFSVLFTAFAVGGVANAVNIVDGFNGLASGFVVIALTGLSIVAGLAGDVNLAVACLAIAAAMVGFWLINWPWGKLFLGDGGSYFGGFSLAWASVMLLERNPSVSAFVPLLICIHPVTEVLFSIYRRRMTRVSPGAPDRLHMHSLVMRRVVYPFLIRIGRGNKVLARRLRNPVTGVVIALVTVPPVLLAVAVTHSPVYATLGCVGFAFLYVAVYARLVRYHWCSPVSFLLAKPAVKFPSA